MYLHLNQLACCLHVYFEALLNRVRLLTRRVFKNNTNFLYWLQIKINGECCCNLFYQKEVYNCHIIKVNTHSWKIAASIDNHSKLCNYDEKWNNATKDPRWKSKVQESKIQKLAGVSRFFSSGCKKCRMNQSSVRYLLFVEL